MPDPGRVHDVSALTVPELERTRRELHAALALARPGSPTETPILAHMAAIDAELATEPTSRPDRHSPPGLSMMRPNGC
jgi:hypothetical protein